MLRILGIFMLVLVVLLFFLTSKICAMDTPTSADLDKIDPKILATQLLETEWNASTAAKFNALDKYKRSEDLKDELLKTELGALFDLSANNNSLDPELVKATKTNYHSAPLVTLLKTPTVLKANNSIKTISMNYNGTVIALTDNSNTLHIISDNEEAKGQQVAVGSAHPSKIINLGPGSICSIKVLGVANLLRVTLENTVFLLHLDTDTLSNSRCRPYTKKLHFSANGNWYIYKKINNEVCIENHLGNESYKVWNDLECIAMNENEQEWLFGTVSNLYRGTKIDCNFSFQPISESPIENIDCVDVTPDGRFGLAVNNFGVCRIGLKEENFPRIGKIDKTITVGRISSCGNFLITGHVNGEVIIHRVIDDVINSDAAHKKTLVIDTKLSHLSELMPVTCLALSGDNKTIAAGSRVGVLIASIKNVTDEFKKFSCSQLTAFLRVIRNGTDQLSNVPIKDKLAEIRIPKKLELIKHLDAKDETNEGFACPICKEIIVNRLTPCNHEFCNVCLQKWMGSNKSCPSCRASLLNYKP